MSSCAKANGEDAMGFFTKDIKTLNDLFVRALQDIYYAEQQIAKNLPEMIEKATDPRHQERLPDASFRDQGPDHPAGEGVEMHGVAAKGVECPAIDGIRKEASEVSGDIDDKQVMDAALIAAAQAVEHYEITRYGTLIAWAEELGHDEIVRFLTTNLNEEKASTCRRPRSAFATLS
ncbi:ferritin-like metal-binding protein YciE [Bradyrhizobium sp. i1.3.6]